MILAKDLPVIPRTLRRWHADGYFPTLVVGRHPSGRGKTSYVCEASEAKILELCRYGNHGVKAPVAHAMIEQYGLGLTSKQIYSRIPPKRSSSARLRDLEDRLDALEERMS